MGHGKYIDPFVGLRPPQDDKGCHSDSSYCHSERSEESIMIGAGEHKTLQYVILPGESRDIDVAVDLAGEGAEVTIKALYLCGASENVSIRTLVHHRAKGCKSNQIINGIAAGSSHFKFDGRIVVAPGADGTEAYQENHNIVLTEEAKVETKPQLEIYADDVKCSHGATTGRLGDDELFYMRSRGIPEKEARTLQMLSFLSPVIPEDRREEIEAAVRSL